MPYKDKRFNPSLLPIARQKIGDYIKLRRQDLKLSQEDLSKMAGLRRATISQVENGEPYHIDTLLAILGSLKVHLELSDLPIDHIPGFDKPTDN